MVSMKYINGLCISKGMDQFIVYEEAVNEIINNLESNIINNGIEIESSLIESTFDDFNNDNKLISESTSDIMRKIGGAIIALGKKFTELVNSVLEKIKNIGFARKTDVQKLSKLIGMHPELKDQVIAHWKSGDLELSDMRSLAELDKQFDQLLELANRKNVNPKSFKERCNRVIRTIDEKPIVKFATGTVVAGITLYFAIRTFPVKNSEAKVNTHKNKTFLRETYAKAVQRIREMENENAGSEYEDFDNQGKYMAMLNVCRVLHNKHEQALGHDLNVIERLNNTLARALDNISDSRAVTAVFGSERNRYHNNMNRLVDGLDDRVQTIGGNLNIKISGNSHDDPIYLNNARSNGYYHVLNNTNPNTGRVTRNTTFTPFRRP